MKIELMFPICSICKNMDKKSGKWICKAFPDGIPDDILLNNFDHSKKYPGQGNEIVFEPIQPEVNNEKG